MPRDVARIEIVTLFITVVSRRGLWQASDHRLTDLGGRIVDDASMKHILIEAEDGKALLAYAGIGKVRDRHISDWVRRVLRGVERPIDGHLAVLKAAADRDLMKYCRNRAHTFSVAAFRANQPTFYLLTNSVPDRPGLSTSFRLFGVKLEGDTCLVHAEGTGAPALPKVPPLGELFHGIIRRRKSKASLGSEVSGVLAQFIRRASETVQTKDTVSPNSVVSYLKSPSDAFIVKTYGWKGPYKITMQHVARQFDVTGILEALIPTIQPIMARNLDRLEKGEPTEPIPDGETLMEALRKHDWGDDRL
jgi:hypothetical protein